MENERSGFLTFIFIWYILGAASQMSNALPLLFYTLLALIANPIAGLALLAFDAFIATSITLTIIFLIRLWRVDRSLKRWTDIVHLFGAIIQVILLLTWGVTVALVPGLEITQTGFWIVNVVLAFSFLLELAFWVGIRSHLARLEREGRASFDRGMFNRSTRRT